MTPALDTPASDTFERMVAAFKALGHPVRLSILRLVVQGPEGGTPAGAIQERIGIPASTLSHHLACLSEAALLDVAREGTSLLYRADFPTLHALTDYLWKDCCAGGGTAGEQPSACARVK